MKKRFKSKKQIKINKIIYILIFILIIYIIKFYISKIKLINSNDILINTFLNSENYYSSNSILLENAYNYMKETVFNSPLYLLESEFKYKNTNSEKTSKMTYKESNKPLVYIYNSHQGETYSYEYLEQYNIVPDVLIASSMLKDKLENLNINTIMENANILEYMEINNLEHKDSYIASRHFLESVINKYDSIKLYIDLHRDAATHEATVTNINGKVCAKILFVIGLEYTTYKENLETVNNINNIILNKYPTLTRGIMKKEGYGVNGIYNQDLNSNVILIEIGGNQNNIEEVNNTLDILASVIGEYLNEKEK